MRIAICDDEEVQRQLLAEYLREWADTAHLLLETVSYPNAENFLFQWEEDKDFDLLILDIEMGQINGVELAMKLRENNEQIPILFITGYEDYMAQGYEVSALHYLLKPVNKQKFFEVLARLQKKTKMENKILLQTDTGMLSVLPSDIWYIEAVGHKSNLITINDEYVLKHSISELEKILEQENGILSCHRSFLVNLQHVSSITKTEFVMDNNMRIPISRGNIRKANAAFLKYYTS